MLEKKVDKLDNDNIFKLLIKLSVPSFIGMATQALYNIIDSIYVGRYSTIGLSALSLAFPIQLLLISLAVGTGIGASTMISRYLGEKKYSLADNVAEHTFFLVIILSGITAILGYFFSSQMIEIFSRDIQLVKYAQSYIKIIMLGSLFMFAPMVFNNILRGEGNTFIPMLVLIIGAVLNVILDPIFIFGLGKISPMGVEGAAYATVLARGISTIFILYIMFKGNNQIKYNLKDFKYSFPIIKEIYFIGFPSIIIHLLSSVMIAGMNIIIGSFGAITLAVAGIYFKLNSFVFMPIFGLLQGFMSIFSYNYGAKNSLRIKKVTNYIFILSLFYCVFCFVILQIFPKEIISLFGNDAELIKSGISALTIISYSTLFACVPIVSSTLFQILNKGMISILTLFLRQILLLLPIMYILSKIYGEKGIWVSFPISEFFTALFSGIFLLIVLKDLFANKLKKDY